jgi:hypothetical protein
MKRSFWGLLILFLAFSGAAAAQEAPETESPRAEEITADAPMPAPMPEADAQESTLVDNLEFISGEISELDENARTVSVRLYGENENTTSEKVLKVNVDDNTDITDGEQDRDLKSLSTGTEVDVEYDPATNLATYIFVY